MADGGVFEVADVRLEVVYAPGHTPGSVCLYCEDLGAVFTGHVLLAEGPAPQDGEFPDFAGPATHRLAKFRGQRQKWFALRFTGRDDEIDPLQSRNGQPAEFDQWRWERLDRVADLVVPFRREVYRTVARHFAKFAR